jgi:hypothetical protein
MDTFVFFLIVGLILTIGVLISVQLNAPGSLGTGRIRRIRRLRTVRTVPGAASTVPVDTVIEEIIDEVEPEAEEEEV